MSSTNRIWKKGMEIGYGSLSTILFFVVWYLASVTKLLNPGIIPDPISVISRLFTNLFKGNLFTTHVILTFQRAGWGFIAALVVGLLLGFSLESLLKKISPGIIPVMQLFEKMNPFALFPVFMLFFGIGELSKILIIFWVAVWPIAFHTISGLQNVDPILIKSAKAMGAAKRVIFGKVIVPAALPDIVTGIKFGALIAFTFVVSVEMLSSSAGLGWFIAEAKHQYNLPNIYSGVLIVAILGIMISRLLCKIEQHLFIWKAKSIQ